MAQPAASLYVTIFFALWPALLVAGLVTAARRAPLAGESPTDAGRGATRLLLGLCAWLALTGLLARAGLFTDFESRPPKLVLAVVVALVAVVMLARSRVGERLSTLPLWMLVGLQGFRLPLECVMHQAAAEGVMPVQMSFSGANFDVVTGALAVALAFALRRRALPAAVLWAFNLLGLALLATIVTIAIASTPMFRAFGEAPERVNTFVAYAPFVWLPTFLVPLALFGHLLLWRRLTRNPG